MTKEDKNWFLTAGLTLCRKFNIDEKIREKFMFRHLDSQHKDTGICAQYYMAMTQSDGTYIPYEGTKYLLNYFNLTEDDWKKNV